MALPDPAATSAEMKLATEDFRRLIGLSTVADLRRPSDGTRWTNRQLLFHMLLGYLIVRALLIIARVFGRLPRWPGTMFARLLDSVRRPFHLVNYLGSCAGALAVPPSRMPGMLERVTGSLERSLRHETEAALHRGMRYPTTWDPCFTDYMTLADIYRFPTRHYQFHRRQLTIPGIDR
jgi:hypothetical protein